MRRPGSAPTGTEPARHRFLRRWLGAGVFLLALGLREAKPHTVPAAAFGPRPDALEYAAGAQAIAQDGRYFLQIGPERVRPRYPPGFSLLLAGPLALGWPAAELWRLTGLFGAGLALLVASLAAAVVRRFRPGHGELVAFVVAGGLWALAPAAVAVGRAVLSDEPATLLVLLGLALAPRLARRPSPALGSAIGSVWALALAVRPVAAVPLVLVLAPAAWLGGRSGGGRAAAKALLGAVAAAGAVVAVVLVLLARSGLPAWPWDGYAFWVPERYGPQGVAWSLDFALHGDHQAVREVAGRRIGNLEFVVRSALGAPGPREDAGAGLLWPGVGLGLSALALARSRWRELLLPGGPLLALGLGLWLAFQLVLYAGYFYAAGRFLLPLFAVSAVAFGAALGVAVAGPRPAARTMALACALAALASSAGGTARLESLVPRRLAVPTRELVEAWLARSDAERAAGVVPFDSVHAQALGLLPPARLTPVHSWGTLADSVHVRRLGGHER